jgi:hypothetical protein
VDDEQTVPEGLLDQRPCRHGPKEEPQYPAADQQRQRSRQQNDDCRQGFDMGQKPEARSFDGNDPVGGFQLGDQVGLVVRGEGHRLIVASPGDRDSVQCAQSEVPRRPWTDELVVETPLVDEGAVRPQLHDQSRPGRPSRPDPVDIERDPVGLYDIDLVRWNDRVDRTIGIAADVAPGGVGDVVDEELINRCLPHEQDVITAAGLRIGSGNPTEHRGRFGINLFRPLQHTLGRTVELGLLL